MPIHRHAHFLQLHLIERGEISFHIDDELYELHGPALFLTPAAVPHSFKIEPDTGGHVLTLHQSVVWRLLQNGLQNDIGNRLERGLCLTPGKHDEAQQPAWRRLTALLDNVHDEWRQNAPAKTLVIDSLVNLILVEIGRMGSITERGTAIHNEDLRLFHQFSAMMEIHFREHWTLSVFAKRIGVSESRLNLVCQHISGQSPKQLLRERQLQEAKRLLSFSKLSASEVAYELGFVDPAYFSRSFKSQTGMTPLTYRHQNTSKVQ